MRIRHRVPTLFNLSMVDVLCCALGCVILLWLLNQREARDQTAAAEQAGRQAEQTQLALDSAGRELTAVRQSLLAGQRQEKTLAGQVEQYRREVEQARTQAQAARLEADGLRGALQQAQGQAKQLGAVVASLNNQHLALQVAWAKDKAAADKALQAVEQERDDKARQLAAVTAQAQELTRRLQSAQGQAAALAAQGQQWQAQLAAAQQQWFQAVARVQVLARDEGQRHTALQAADKQLAELMQHKYQLEQALAAQADELAGAKSQAAKLAGQVQNGKANADQRFAGLALTGKRVAFLLDMSGSMGKVDYHQSDSKKWPHVCATLGKVMASLPDLEKFQVILFADGVSYPLGGAGAWHDYRPEVSDKVVVELVGRAKPAGGTNMAAAFKEAFRLRPLGLDTIYLLSDGLPNTGPGLPAQADHLTDRERTARCGKYLREALGAWNGPVPHQPKVRVNAIGFYYDSPDLGAFLWALARDHDGGFVGMSQP